MYINDANEEFFSFEDDLNFNIEFESKNLGQEYQFNILISTLLGQKLLHCYDIADIQGGFQKVTCTIPKGFLNTGEYRVSMKMSSTTDDSDCIELNDILSFSISPQGLGFNTKYPVRIKSNNHFNDQTYLIRDEKEYSVG